MAIKFQANESPRQVDPVWLTMIKALVDIKDKLVLEIGCKEGFYTRALADLGACAVTGLETSREQIQIARENLQDNPRIDLVRGSPLNTGLIGERYDVVLIRDILHRYTPENMRDCLEEAYRLLGPGGLLIIQEQMSDDLILPGSKNHIHGYFFERYPKLHSKEFVKTANTDAVKHILQVLGFQNIDERKYWQTGEAYPNLNALAEALLSQNKESLQQNFTEKELEEMATYITYLEEQLQQDDGAEIITQERWTILSATKGHSTPLKKFLSFVEKPAP